MADVVDGPTRSRMMSGIGGKNTKPEIRLRQALHARGFRFRLHCKDLPGTPDIVLPGRRVAILVNGCFWHRHEGCRYTATPRTNEEFWRQKFHENVDRDRRHAEMLHTLGWRVAVVWECALKHSIEDTAYAVEEWLHGNVDVLVVGQITG